MTLQQTSGPTDAERIDRAVSALLGDEPVAVPATLAGELATARAVQAGLHPVPPSAEFEASLARRLADGAFPSIDHRLTEFVRHHHRLVLTGAVGSVVVSTASVALMAWRLGHRQS